MKAALHSNPTITLPARTMLPGDLMDHAIDKLRTVHLALSPENATWLDDTALTSVWATLDQVIQDLTPLRDTLQGVLGSEVSVNSTFSGSSGQHS